ILQEIKALEPNLPVIMMTAVKTVRTTVAAMKLGASDYLTKPFQHEELLATIRRVLEERTGRLGAHAERGPPAREALPRTHRILFVGGAPGWRATRGVVRPPVNAGDLMRQVGSVLPLNRANDTWPQLGESVSRTVDYLGHHFAEDLTVEGIAEIIDISSSHLAHLFRSEIGMSVRDYLTRVRVAMAQDLLAHTDEKLESVAAQLGFADTSHLTHAF